MNALGPMVSVVIESANGTTRHLVGERVAYELVRVLSDMISDPDATRYTVDRVKVFVSSVE